jgi:hypothetical protein
MAEFDRPGPLYAGGINADIATMKADLVVRVIALMRDQQLSKTRMAEIMGSRTQLDRLLDPACISTSLETVGRAASCVGCTARLVLD